MNVRCKWTKVPNQNILAMHVDVSLWDTSYVSAYNVPLSTEQQQLADAIEGVHGVIESRFEKYTVWITKGECFHWADVCPRIENAFSQWAGAPVLDFQDARQP